MQGRHAFLADEATLDDFVTRFHGHRLAKAEWTHGAHVALCAYHAWDGDVETTFALLRDAIRSFNESVGTANTATSGYHETLTRLWTTVIAAYLGELAAPTRWDAVCAAVARYGDDRGLHRRYYRHDVVADPVARASWVPPDLPGE